MGASRRADPVIATARWRALVSINDGASGVSAWRRSGTARLSSIGSMTASERPQGRAVARPARWCPAVGLR
jgi:hypothetical protein